MRERLTTAALAAGLLAALWLAGRGTPGGGGKPDAPARPSPVRPAPAKPDPKPPRRPGPWVAGGAPVGAFVAGGRGLHGQEITVDLPDSEHLKNTGGSDGAGLCVFCSIDHAARYQNVPALVGFRDWMRRHPGGGHPQKLDAMIARMCKERGVEAPAYVQHTGGDLEFLRLALKTGRYVSVTYDGRDGVFYNGRIAHMVNLVHLSEQAAVIHDNNYPGKYLWMSPQEFAARWKGNGGGWAVVLLSAPPPPPPK